MSRDVLDIIRSLGEKERALTGSVFISPVYRTTQVAASVGGLVHKLDIPKVKPGWYRIRPEDMKRAVVEGEADLMEVEEYLKRLSKHRFVLLDRKAGCHLGLPLKNNSLGMDVETPVPVLLATDMAQPFDQVVCGFDGAHFWYRENDPGVDLSKADYLRESYEKGLEPEELRYSGLSVEEKIAYTCRFILDVGLKEKLKKHKIQKDVEHAGGSFLKYTEKDDHYSVTYEVGGNRYTSYVSKDPAHHVLTAGICLSDTDSQFDLASLIGVIREGQDKGLIHRYHNTEE